MAVARIGYLVTMRAPRSGVYVSRSPGAKRARNVNTGAMPHELFQVALALAQRTLAILQRAFVGPVLHLDAHGAPVIRVVERREQCRPIDVAESRQLRNVPAEPENAQRVQLVGVDARVLGVE